MQPKVGVVTLNRNGLQDTIECINSLISNSYKNIEIIIVDNDSKNNEGEILKEKFNDRNITIILNNNNDGFAGGCNIGIKKALELGCDYVLLFNNDAVAKNGFLERIVEVAESSRDYGIVGPAITYYQSNKLWFAGGIIGEWSSIFRHQGKGKDKSYLKNKKPYETEYITGCCMMIKKELLKVQGLLDEEYFAYYEEADYCYKARKNGWKCILVPDAIIEHKKSASAGNIGSDKLSPTQAYLIGRNSVLFGKKNLKGVNLFSYILSTLTLFQLFNLIRNIRSSKSAINFYKGIISIIIKGKKTIYCIIIIIVSILFFLRNSHNLLSNNRFIHPDEISSFEFTNSKVNQNNYKINKYIELNRIMGINVFGRDFNVYDDEGNILPEKMLGEYNILSIYSSIFGIRNIFFIVSLYGAIGLYIVYTFLIKFFEFKASNGKLFIVLFSTLPPVLLWNNMLYSNIIASTIFLSSFYLFVYSSNRDKFWLLIISGISIGIAVIIRIEFVLITTIFVFFSLIYNRFNRFGIIKKLIYLGIGCSLPIILFIAINLKYYGEPIHLSYFRQIKSSSTNNHGNSTKEGIILNIYKRFFTQDISPNYKRLFRNIRENVRNYFMGFAILGFIHGRFKGKQTSNLSSSTKALFIALSYWCYNTLGGYHRGEGQGLITTVHGRYIYIYYYIFCYFCILGINFAFGNGIFKKTLLLIIISHNLVQGIITDGGIIRGIKIKERGYEINNQITKNDFVLANLESKYILNGLILNYDLFSTLNANQILNFKEIIKQKNGKVLLLENKNHYTYKNIEGMLLKENIKYLKIN